MSHFSVIVILPNSIPHDKAKDEIDRLLKPYDENAEVPEYTRPCYCVGGVAKNQAREKANELTGGIDKARETFKTLLHAKAPDLVSFDPMFGKLDPSLPEKEAQIKFREMEKRQDKLWKEHLAPFHEAEAKILAEHPLRGKPDANCDECKGTGVETRTYNPMSKWDWYMVGGRWQGMFSDYDPSKDPRNREACMICNATGMRNDKLAQETRKKDPTYTCNGCNGTGIQEAWPTQRKSEGTKTGDIGPLTYLVDEKKVAYAVVTPDGLWHSRGKMGWFGMSNDENDTWDEDCVEIFRRYSLGFYGVVVDCHI